jgi:hypothetical protein
MARGIAALAMLERGLELVAQRYHVDPRIDVNIDLDFGSA